MFSLKAINPYDFLDHSPTSQTIINRTNVIRNHFEFSEKLHQNERQLLLERIEDATHKDEREHYEGDLHYHEHFFERVHRVATLLILYSLLENIMAKICKVKADEINVEFQLEKNNIIKLKEFLKKEININFSDSKIEKHWVVVTNFNKIRNALVHSEGDLKQYRQTTTQTKVDEVVRIVKGTPELSMYSNTILISSEYVDLNINTVENLLLAIQKN